MRIVRPPIRRFIPWVLPITLLLPVSHRLKAEGIDHNRAPNAALERGTASTFDNWHFQVYSGAANMAVMAHPSPVQSGSRAARLIVTAPGDIFLTTVPETTSIAVQPFQTNGFSTLASFVFSARLRCSLGAQANLRLIEWRAGPQVVADRNLANGTCNDLWATVESAPFMLDPTTQWVSLRLNAATAGTFDWDDVAFWQVPRRTRDLPPPLQPVVGPEMRLADFRHYVAQTTPGVQLCTGNTVPVPAQNTVCTDGHRDTASNEFMHTLRIYRNTAWSDLVWGLIGNAGQTGTSLGTLKDYIADNPPGAQWRCFTDPGKTCGGVPNAVNAPTLFNRGMMLPVLDVTFTPTNPGPPNHTPGAFLLSDSQPVAWHFLDPSTGASVYGDTVHKRAYAYLARSADFGGSVGTQSMVLVIEEEGGVVAGCSDGAGLERYMFVRGLGQVRAQSWGTSTASGSSCPVPQGSSCQPVVYCNLSDGLFNSIQAIGDYNPPLSSPAYNQVNWW